MGDHTHSHAQIQFHTRHKDIPSSASGKHHVNPHPPLVIFTENGTENLFKSLTCFCQQRFGNFRREALQNLPVFGYEIAPICFAMRSEKQRETFQFYLSALGIKQHRKIVGLIICRLKHHTSLLFQHPPDLPGNAVECVGGDMTHPSAARRPRKLDVKLAMLIEIPSDRLFIADLCSRHGNRQSISREINLLAKPAVDYGGSPVTQLTQTLRAPFINGGRRSVGTAILKTPHSMATPSPRSGNTIIYPLCRRYQPRTCTKGFCQLSFPTGKFIHIIPRHVARHYDIIALITQPPHQRSTITAEYHRIFRRCEVCRAVSQRDVILRII